MFLNKSLTYITCPHNIYPAGWLDQTLCRWLWFISTYSCFSLTPTVWLQKNQLGTHISKTVVISTSITVCWDIDSSKLPHYGSCSLQFICAYSEWIANPSLLVLWVPWSGMRHNCGFKPRVTTEANFSHITLQPGFQAPALCREYCSTKISHSPLWHL